MSIKDSVIRGINTPFYGGPTSANQVIPRDLPNVPLGPIVGISRPPVASGGGAGASNPNKSSSLSESGEFDPENFNEANLEEDIEKIKEIEKELKKKEADQVNEKNRLEEEEKNIKTEKDKAERLEGKGKEEANKKIEEREKKLEEDTKKFNENQKLIAKEREDFDNKTAAPFAQKDKETGKVIKKDGNIQFLDKKSEEYQNLIKLIKAKDKATILDVEKALQELNKYREKYPLKENGLETINPYSNLLGQTKMAPPPKVTDIFGTLNFEEANV